MTATAEHQTTPVATPADEQEVSQRLLESSAMLSRDPQTEVDWESPLDKSYYGTSPEWSSLYGTPYWDELTEEQRKELTRQEAACVADTGIWFEMILQQMMLRDIYTKDMTTPEFQWALTEIADECRHSIMFARGAAKLDAPTYHPPRLATELGRFFKTVAFGEMAYAAILVAEEVLDVMQRDWMRDDRVVPFVRTINNIHVVEESRHMTFAREETRARLEDASWLRRQVSAVLVATAGYVIVSSMWNSKIYEQAGLDVKRAKREAKSNENHHAKLRASCTGLMDFLSSTGLLTTPAKMIYRLGHLI